MASSRALGPSPSGPKATRSTLRMMKRARAHERKLAHVQESTKGELKGYLNTEALESLLGSL